MSHTPSYSPVLDSLENIRENLIEDSNPITNPFYYAQDRQSWYDEVATKTCEQSRREKSEEKIKKKKIKSNSLKNTSFIMRKETGDVRHLIQIIIHDLDDRNIDEINTESGNAAVNVQHLVTSAYDDIMDETEHLVCV
ncbi:unnamed protein product [Parnassius mnemosyne]|uniref:Uncharacterized protein n=1 Tax=Parnassius mnemosyne TaxID=213953 RepID=A0AAV1L508_9NEOP